MMGTAQPLPGHPLGRWSQAKVWLRHNGLTRRFAVDSGWAFCSQGVAFVAGLLETFLLARLLGVANFGLLMLLVAIPDLVYGILDCRSGEVAIKFLPELRRSDRGGRGVALLRTVLFVNLVLAVLGLLTISVLVVFLGNWVSVSREMLLPSLIVGTGAGLRLTVGYVGSYLRVTKRFPLAAQLGMVASVIRILLLTLVVFYTRSVSGACWAFALSDLSGFFILFSGFRYGLRREGLSLFDWSERLPREARRAVLRFMFHTNLSLTVRIVAKKGDVLAIGALASPSVVALYKIGQRIANSLMLASDPLVTVVYPTLSHYNAEGRKDEMRKLLRLLTCSLLGCSTLFVLGFGLFGERLIGAAAGRDFSASFHCAMIMIGGSMLSVVFFWLRPLLLVHGLTGGLLIVGLVATGSRFVAIFVLMPLLGLDGAAWSFVIYCAIVVAGTSIVLRNHAAVPTSRRSV